MRNLKVYEEWNYFDSDKIIRILNKTKGWGNGVIQYMNDFENSDFFLNPQDENEYSDPFHVYLTDITSSPNRRNLPSLPLGKWKPAPTVISPTSWYSKSTYA